MTELQVDIREKTYRNGVCSIRGLHFQAHSGQFTAIVGPSGTGKTTLLNIIAGLDTEFQGKVGGNGGKIAFMFQEARLLPWLTVAENIELVLQGLPITERAAAHARMPLLLEQVGLQDFRHAYPRQLSGGMQKRASLVRAFVIQPDLLLMDEPFQSLDEPTANQLRSLLLDLWQETRASVLFVTHNLREALTLADRVLFLSARPAQVIMDYAVECARPRQADSPELSRLHSQLLQTHPQLLSGQLATPQEHPHV